MKLYTFKTENGTLQEVFAETAPQKDWTEIKGMPALVRYLELLGQGQTEPLFPWGGICRHVLLFGVKEPFNVYDLAKRWPNFSGSRSYPVPFGGSSPQEAYNQTIRLWEAGAYSNSRRELCLFLAEELRKEYLS